MNRAPTTNGDATSALAKGGYDAYFAQLDEHPGGGAAAAAGPAGPPGISSAAPGAEPTTAPESGTDHMSSAVPHPPVPGPSTEQPPAGAPQAAVSPPQPTGLPPAAPEAPAVDDGELADLRQRAATAHQQAVAEEQQAIASTAAAGRRDAARGRRPGRVAGTGCGGIGHLGFAVGRGIAGRVAVLHRAHPIRAE
ncbi:hypothetical protein [Nocardia testacea]|uniref:hypothetical protein n=1 Tax=Nocardia testacea TaxID=248551 RepID=UPI0002DD300A|nr:hypothetical protein [Nocardia testacea]